MQVALVQTDGDFARMLELHHLETNILGGKSLRVIDFDGVIPTSLLFTTHSQSTTFCRCLSKTTIRIKVGDDGRHFHQGYGRKAPVFSESSEGQTPTARLISQSSRANPSFYHFRMALIMLNPNFSCASPTINTITPKYPTHFRARPRNEKKKSESCFFTSSC